MYSVKEIADILGVTKQTINNVIKRLQIEPSQMQDRQKRLYSLEDTKRIIVELNPFFNFDSLLDSLPTKSSKSSKSSKLSNFTDIDNGNTEPHTSGTDKVFELYEARITDLQKQIEGMEKDKDRLNETITNIQKDKDFLMIQLNRQTMYISELESKIQLIESVPEPQPEPEKPQSFWKRIKLTFTK